MAYFFIWFFWFCLCGGVVVLALYLEEKFENEFLSSYSDWKSAAFVVIITALIFLITGLAIAATVGYYNAHKLAEAVR